MHPTADLKSAARKIFLQTLAGIDIREAMERKLAFSGSRFRCGDRDFDLANYSRAVLISFGKAALTMAEALVALLPADCACTGIVAMPKDATSAHSAFLQSQRFPDGLQIFQAGHPTPDEQSFAAARAILKLLSKCDEKTIIFFLISGGGSALVELPLDSTTSLGDIQSLNKILIGCGAPIDEINAVRKHFSAIKGGRLAAAARGATKITLGITDVPEGRESSLASGPTLPDPTTVTDVREIAKQYDLLSQFPASIRSQFESRIGIQETPKENDAAFRGSQFEIVLGLHDLFHHAHIAAESDGFMAVCDNTIDDQPLERAADELLSQLERLQKDFPHRSVAVIADGELSSPVRGNGIGGRNSAFVLECVSRIVRKRIAVLSAGTDGIDGNSSAAGAVADGDTHARAKEFGLDAKRFADHSDAYSFFAALGDAILTGRTGLNLRDLRILLAAPPHELQR